MPEVSPEAGKTGLFTEMPTPNDPDWSTIGPHESVDIANFPMKRVAERAGFEPALGDYPKHAFQACDLNRSSIPPGPFAGCAWAWAGRDSSRAVQASPIGANVLLRSQSIST